MNVGARERNRAPIIALLAAFSTFLAASAFAQDGRRDGDRALSQGDLREYLSGHVIEFFDGSKSRYGTDSRYSYTYTDDGPPWTGDYAVGDDSEVCVAFDNGSTRCDRVIEADERMVLITTDGLRFPIRNRTVSDD